MDSMVAGAHCRAVPHTPYQRSSHLYRVVIAAVPVIRSAAEEAQQLRVEHEDAVRMSEGRARAAEAAAGEARGECAVLQRQVSRQPSCSSRQCGMAIWYLAAGLYSDAGGRVFCLRFPCGVSPSCDCLLFQHALWVLFSYRNCAA